VLSYEPLFFSFGGEKKEMSGMEAPVYYFKTLFGSSSYAIYLYFPRTQNRLVIYTYADIDVDLPEDPKARGYGRSFYPLFEIEKVRMLLEQLKDESFVRKFERVLELYPILSANIITKAIEDIDALLKRREEAIAKKEFEERVRRQHVETYWQLLRAWRTEQQRDDPAGKIMRLEKGWITVYDKDPEYFYVLYLTDNGELYEHRTKDVLKSELAFAYLLEGRKIRSFRKRGLREIPAEVARAFAKLLRGEGKEELLVTLAV